MVAVLAQAASGGGDAMVGILTSIPPALVTAYVLWKILERREARCQAEADAKDARIRELTDKLLDLAETGTKVAATTAEVVREESPDLDRQLDRIFVLLRDLGNRR